MRYDTGVPIGSGGMGTVVRAFDPVLARHVAIKLLRRDEPELAERMLREARAQAAVDHPNVAKVYEVGHLDDGRPFIAMQLVDGRPLDEVAPRLPLDQKIRLVATVADAVQAAHATGLVHRDLKPSNILVEEDPERGLVPFVVDFGIARMETMPGPTVSGQVVGTPGYMAPEQASGATGTLDRRADVFSLGVILYELVGGGHPFRGDTPVEKLVSLLNDEPTPLRPRAAHVPPDLEAVIFRCLEKQPARRYPSARALADDLHRYLRGEPVEAHQVTRVGMLWRRARRHPAVAATVAVAAVAVVTAGAISAVSVMSARRQTREAQALGQRVARTDATMRLAHLLPPHDLGHERALVRSEMAAIRSDMERFRGLAHAAAHYALGRGHLALAEAEDARRELDEAWRLGYRTPEAALAAARARAELYRARLDRVRRQRDEEARRAGMEVAEAELGQPALELLRAAGGAPTQEALIVRGTLELAAREPTEALRRADELAALDAGGAEAAAHADALRGEAFLQQARELRWGRDGDAHGRALASALAAFERTIATLRSDPAAHAGLCRAWCATVERDADAGSVPADSLARAEETCRLAARIDPDRPEPLVELGFAHTTSAQFSSRRGQDPAADLDRAQRLAEEAGRTAPASYEAAALAGTVLLIRAEGMFERPREATRLLRDAIAAFGRAQVLDPHRPEAFHLQGNALLDLLDHQRALGEDAIPTVQQALAAFARALDLPEGRTRRTYNSMGAAYTDLGLLQRLRGEDPRDSLRRGIEAVDRAIAMSPGYATAHNTRGLALWEMAEYAAATGSDPLPDFTAAEESFAAMMRADPARMVAHTNTAGLLLGKARWQLLGGVDPSATLLAVERRLAVFRERFPWDYELDSAEAALLRAAWARRAGAGAVAENLQRAARHAAVLLRDAPDEPSGEVVLAEVERVRVEALSERSPLPSAEIERACARGLDHAARALAISARVARAHAARAVLLLARARLASGAEERSRLAHEAHAAATAALAAEPLLRDDAVRALAGGAP